jgi:hypothetical protein
LRSFSAVPLYVHPGNQLAFFEIAATLIPLLLFGGVVAERIRPDDTHDKNGLLSRGSGIAIVSCYAILAEAVAIDAVVTGEWEWWGEVLVVVFVVGGMALVVGALVYPWYAKLDGLSGEEGKTAARGLAVSTVLSILLIAGWGAVEMLSNVDRAGESQTLEAITAAIAQKTTEVTAVENRVLAVSVALARAKRQIAVATARDESGAVLEGFTVELETLDTDLLRERRTEDALHSRLTKLRRLAHSVVDQG